MVVLASRGNLQGAGIVLARVVLPCWGSSLLRHLCRGHSASYRSVPSLGLWPSLSSAFTPFRGVRTSGALPVSVSRPIIVVVQNVTRLMPLNPFRVSQAGAHLTNFKFASRETHFSLAKVLLHLTVCSCGLTVLACLLKLGMLAVATLLPSTSDPGLHLRCALVAHDNPCQVRFLVWHCSYGGILKIKLTN